MAELNYEFEYLSSREGFNRSLGHFRTVSSMLGSLENNTNIADILNVYLHEKKVEQGQLAPIIFSLLNDKYLYSSESHNMESTIDSLNDLCEEVKGWNGVDLVITYQHPDLGFCLINPKNSEHWEAIQSLRKYELITVFAGEFGKTKNERRDVYKLAIDQIFSISQAGS